MRLPGAARTLDSLGATVLLGISTGDTALLQSVRLTEHEHNDLVWPELPASDPAVNFPVDFAWTNISIRNRAALVDIFSQYRGSALDLQRVECRGRTQEFESFVVHTNCWVSFSAEGDPVPPQQLFKDVLDWDGELKIFRYYGF